MKKKAPELPRPLILRVNQVLFLDELRVDGFAL